MRRIDQVRRYERVCVCEYVCGLNSWMLRSQRFVWLCIVALADGLVGCCVINWPCCIWVANQVAEWRQHFNLTPWPGPRLHLQPQPQPSVNPPAPTVSQVSHYSRSSSNWSWSHNWILFSVVWMPPAILKYFAPFACAGAAFARHDQLKS